MVLIVESSVEALLSESQLSLDESVFELRTAAFLLLLKSVLAVEELIRGPVVDPVNLVECHDKRYFL